MMAKLGEHARSATVSRDDSFTQEKQMKFFTTLVLLGLAGMALVGCSQPSTYSPRATVPKVDNSPNRVVVYCMHSRLHCPSCEWIENTTRRTLQDTFPSELASGRLAVQEDLAKRYNVQGVSVLVVNRADGREVSYQELGKVWDLKMQNAEFRAYIIEAVRAALKR
jgi:hypothetical protein